MKEPAEPPLLANISNTGSLVSISSADCESIGDQYKLPSPKGPESPMKPSPRHAPTERRQSQRTVWSQSPQQQGQIALQGAIASKERRPSHRTVWSKNPQQQGEIAVQRVIPLKESRSLSLIKTEPANNAAGIDEFQRKVSSAGIYCDTNDKDISKTGQPGLILPKIRSSGIPSKSKVFVFSQNEAISEMKSNVSPSTAKKTESSSKNS
mmetsp:Transcript_19225/g.24808  ORF Transcript_19225/g.24808 Transcript_19225/m.24808 type:complete len:209 (+) Transcript_19225:3-629(+)